MAAGGHVYVSKLEYNLPTDCEVTESIWLGGHPNKIEPQALWVIQYFDKTRMKWAEWNYADDEATAIELYKRTKREFLPEYKDLIRLIKYVGEDVTYRVGEMGQWKVSEVDNATKRDLFISPEALELIRDELATDASDSYTIPGG
jgi:hypothetical protein